MANRSVEYLQSAGLTNNPMTVASHSSIEVTHTDSYILGGWVTLDSTTGNLFHQLLMMKGGVTTPAMSYGLWTDAASPYNNSTIKFTAKKDSSSTQTVDSTPKVLDSATAFVLGWVDANAGTINVKVNNNATDSAAISLSSFTDPGGTLGLFQPQDNTSGWGSRFTHDSWFFCKNPSSMTDAINTIMTYVYNGGYGISYVSLNSSMKTTMGLVSWWNFDETGTNNRLDSHGSNTFTYNAGSVQDANALTSGSILYSSLSDNVTATSNEQRVLSYLRTYLDSITSIDSVQKTVILDAFVEALTASDTLDVQPNKVLNDFMFFLDNLKIFKSPVGVIDSVKLADWLTIKRNPSISTWTD